MIESVVHDLYAILTTVLNSIKVLYDLVTNLQEDNEKIWLELNRCRKVNRKSSKSSLKLGRLVPMATEGRRRTSKVRRRFSMVNLFRDAKDKRAIDVAPEPEEEEVVEPFLYPNEVVVAHAQNVLKFASLKAHKSGLSGTLFVTNFKVTFVTASLHVDSKENEIYRNSMQSDFMSYHDICLTEIDDVYIYVEGSKRKKLSLITPLPTKIQELCIVLKSMRKINFSFRFTPGDEDLRVTKALKVHTNPTSVNLLYSVWTTPPPETGVPEFRTAEEWEKELNRCRCKNWRVTKHNEFYAAFSTLPNAFIVPKGITDNELQTAADSFKGVRPIVWCWGTPRGAAIVRMPQLASINALNNIENNLLKWVHKSHPQKVQPTIVDCDQKLSSLKAIQLSYNSLKKLHTPDTVNTFYENEKAYLSKWHSSGWLTHVQLCMELAFEAAGVMAIHNSSIVLQEGEGRDLSCVISSIIQIVLDPYSRTFRGFHALIQKEWVSLGHPFNKRLGRTYQQTDDQLCPVWLLFLDCVYQISVQCPAAFEFSEDYLVALWEASHCSIYSSFMFDSMKDRIAVLKDSKVEFKTNDLFMWPLWSWWGCTKGQRTTLQKFDLKQKLSKLASKKTNLDRRASVPDEAAIRRQELELTMRMKTLMREEQHIADSFALCASESESRSRLRQKFVNFSYVQNLISSLVSSNGIERINDRLTNAYVIWQRIKHLVGRGKTPLPYDMCQPPPNLELDRGLRVSSAQRLVPWTYCFGRWLGSPTDLPEGETRRRVILPLEDDKKVFWEHLMRMVSRIESYSQLADQKGL